MADVDVGKLLALVDELNQKSKKFSDAAHTILSQATQLDGKAQGLYDNASSWAGKGCKAFETSWVKYHGSTINASLTLAGTAQSLSTLATKLNDHAQKIQTLQEQATAGFVVTGLLVVADIVQLGLDPITDGATVGTGGASAAVEAEISDEAAAIAELDAQISVDLDTVASQIIDTTQLGALDLPAMDLDELEGLEGNLTNEEQQLINPLDETDFIADDTAQGGGFPEDQRLPYDAPGEVFEQKYDGSCIAACCKMVLNDDGLEVPEAYIRDAAGIDAQAGGYISDVPDAMDGLGSPTNYSYESNLTLDQLESDTAGGKSAITSISFPGGGAHAIVVDGVEDGMVLIRDPLGEAYKVTVEDFVKLWGRKAVIATP